ncbi:MAG: flavin reductase family protein [Saprospiraceae bacterium]|nr:flavin reductase family protein [Saprospiraceae bacterium]
MMDTLELRKVMGQFATGVTVITTQSGEDHFGFTANSYTSVSLEPPLILFCLHKDSKGCPVFLKNGAFAVNILADDQVEISNGFANRALSAEERFELISYTKGKSGSPIIDEAMGYLDCRLSSSLESGDHVIFIGEVIDMGQHPDKRPLIYFQGGYRELMP